MKIHQTATLTLLAAAIISLAAIGQQQQSAAPSQNSQAKPASGAASSSGSTQSMPGMQMDDMPHQARVSGFVAFRTRMQNDSNPDKKKPDPDGAVEATKAMSGAMSGKMPGMSGDDDDMHDMGPHMHMTDLRPATASDRQRADEIVATLRPALERYKDYHAALADGFHIFAPNVAQPTYHFTSSRNAIKAQFVFDAARPTSLLYRKTADGYELIGAMYTAPRRYSDEQLDARVPLSIARWHEHVNFCLPRLGTPIGSVDWKQFGLHGAIVSEEACNAAGGRWYPIVFGWMVHVYPYETDPAKIWAH